MVKVPGDDFKLKRGICPKCGKESFTNASGTRFCTWCGWWDMSENIYQKKITSNREKITWCLDFSMIKEDKKSAELDDKW